MAETRTGPSSSRRARNERLGFIELWTLVDYFTGERHGHISNIVVAPEFERRGVARALIRR